MNVIAAVTCGAVKVVGMSFIIGVIVGWAICYVMEDHNTIKVEVKHD